MRFALSILLASSMACRQEPEKDIGAATTAPVETTTAVTSATDTGAGVPLSWLDVDAGYLHACGILSDGRLHCWGEERIVDAAHADIVGFVQVDVSNDMGCALREAGTVHCWCSPLDYSPDLCDRAPGFDDPPHSFKRIEVSVNAACGTQEDDSIRCWGSPGWGVASKPPPAGPVLDWDLDKDHACAVLPEDGSIACWGDVDLGGHRPPDGVVFAQIGVGRSHACGLDVDGHLHCWGRLGTEKEDGTFDPFPDPPAGEFVEVISWNQISCALREDRSAECWYDKRQLNEVYPGGPAWAPPDESWAAIGLGEWFGCGVNLDGEAFCWPDDPVNSVNPIIDEMPSLSEL